MIFSAANENFLKINGGDSVIDSPISEFLTFVNFLQRKNQLDASRIKRNMKK